MWNKMYIIIIEKKNEKTKKIFDYFWKKKKLWKIIYNIFINKKKTNKYLYIYELQKKKENKKMIIIKIMIIWICHIKATKNGCNVPIKKWYKWINLTE